MFFTASVYAHAAAFLAYGIFAVLLAFRGARSWLNGLMILAAFMTSVWALTVILLDWSILPVWPSELAGPLRDGAWFAVVLAVLYSAGQGPGIWRRLVFVTAAVIAVDALVSALNIQAGTVLGIPVDARATGLVTAVLGLILVENMLRNLSRDEFWAAKLLGIGLFAVLVFQFLVRLPEFLTATPADGLIIARPLMFLMVLPLFVVTAVRSPTLQLRIHSSRRIVFHTAALIAVGILLQGTAVAAYYVRYYGGDNATVLSIVLGFGGAVAVAVALASAGIRSRLRIFINENFFSYKYDYRLEWNKFIRALSAWEEGDIPLRVLRTLAEILDSPGGALWVYRESWHQFMPVAHWSFHIELAPIAPEDHALAAFEDSDCTYLALLATDGNASAALWHRRFPAAWIAVPLRYRGTLVGVAVVNKPRAERKLDWEDKNLIGLVALQLAAYLVQEETAQALADARQLEEFNKRFAFILHDTKNTIGQLSLLVRNAEQFGHEEEFRKDMVVTLRNSVEKLQALLAQLRGEKRPKAAAPAMRESVDLTTLVSDFVAEKRRLGLNVAMRGNGGPVYAELADRNAFLGVLEHVVMNAVEAAPKDAPVGVKIAAAGGSVRVAVDDCGPGMSAQFIADELFRPLRSTKGSGFGIGAYQAREIMRDLGGDIDVRSKLGEGTTVALSLPAVVAEQEVARA
jgi:putative PEP-CTERM system histidine kinase